MLEPSTPTLKERLERLPQELYDRIHDEVFTIPPVRKGSYRFVGPNYRPPPVLQINKEARARHQRDYYSTIFCGHIKVIEKWLESLSAEQRLMIVRVGCWYTEKRMTTLQSKLLEDSSRCIIREKQLMKRWREDMPRLELRATRQDCIPYMYLL